MNSAKNYKQISRVQRNTEIKVFVFDLKLFGVIFAYFIKRLKNECNCLKLGDVTTVNLTELSV